MFKTLQIRHLCISLLLPFMVSGCLSEGFSVDETLLTVPDTTTPPPASSPPPGGGDPVEPSNPYLTSEHFVSVWKTDNTVASGNEDFSLTAAQGLNNRQIRLPLVNGVTYNFDVEWGDGSTSQVTSWDDVDATHTYAVAGTYTVVLKGSYPHLATATIDVGNGNAVTAYSTSEKLVDVISWGDTKWQSMHGMLAGSKISVFTATNHPDLSEVEDLSFMFFNAKSFNSQIEFDTSNVTNMAGLFLGASAFNKNLILITDNVTNMAQMFEKATVFAGSLNFSSTAAVTNMDRLFYDARDFNGDLRSWDVGAVVSHTDFDFNANSWLTANKPNL